VPDFGLKDKVYVIKKTWKTDRPLNKLDYPLASPFEILNTAGYSYCLKLPTSYKIWLIFYTNRLRKDLNNPLLSQVNPELKAKEVNGELEWEVEKILSSRVLHGKLHYKVEWRG
jgi:hypothetical protein